MIIFLQHAGEKRWGFSSMHFSRSSFFAFVSQDSVKDKMDPKSELLCFPAAFLQMSFSYWFMFGIYEKAVHFPAKWRLLLVFIFITLSVPTLIRKSAKITQFSSCQSLCMECHSSFGLQHILYASSFNSVFNRFFRLSLRPSVTELWARDRTVFHPIFTNSHFFDSHVKPMAHVCTCRWRHTNSTLTKLGKSLSA